KGICRVNKFTRARHVETDHIKVRREIDVGAGEREPNAFIDPRPSGVRNNDVKLGKITRDIIQRFWRAELDGHTNHDAQQIAKGHRYRNVTGLAHFVNWIQLLVVGFQRWVRGPGFDRYTDKSRPSEAPVDLCDHFCFGYAYVDAGERDESIWIFFDDFADLVIWNNPQWLCGVSTHDDSPRNAGRVHFTKQKVY